MSDIIFSRFFNNGISDRFESITECVSTLKGVQSQIYNAAKVSIFNRTKNIHFKEIDSLLDSKKIINGWGQRCTLHFYSTNDWPLIIASHNGYETWFRKKFKHSPGIYIQLYDDVCQLINRGPAFSRSDLDKLQEKYQINNLTQWGGILIDLGLNGLVCNPSTGERNKKYIYAPQWIDTNLPTIDSQQAEIVLMESYFLAYGPATLRDFCHWRNMKVSDAIQILGCCENVLAAFQLHRKTYYVHRNAKSQTMKIPEQFTTMLYRFDPILLAYHDKTWLLDSAYHKLIWQSAGHVNPVLIQNGRFKSLWKMANRNGKIFFHFTLFDTLVKKDLDQVHACCSDLANYLGASAYEVKVS